MPLGKDAGLGFDISGCQNYGPFLGPYDNSAPIIKGTQKRGIGSVGKPRPCSVDPTSWVQGLGFRV